MKAAPKCPANMDPRRAAQIVSIVCRVELPRRYALGWWIAFGVIAVVALVMKEKMPEVWEVVSRAFSGLFLWIWVLVFTISGSVSIIAGLSDVDSFGTTSMLVGYGVFSFAMAWWGLSSTDTGARLVKAWEAREARRYVARHPELYEDEHQ